MGNRFQIMRIPATTIYILWTEFQQLIMDQKSRKQLKTFQFIVFNYNAIKNIYCHLSFQVYKSLDIIARLQQNRHKCHSTISFRIDVGL